MVHHESSKLRTITQDFYEDRIVGSDGFDQLTRYEKRQWLV
jgi:hypothetical protein